MVQPIRPYTKMARTTSEGDSRIRPGPQCRIRPYVRRRLRGADTTGGTVAVLVVVTGTSVLCCLHPPAVELVVALRLLRRFGLSGLLLLADLLLGGRVGLLR